MKIVVLTLHTFTMKYIDSIKLVKNLLLLQHFPVISLNKYHNINDFHGLLTPISVIPFPN